MARVAALDLVPGVLAGETRAIARLLTRAEAGDDEGRPALEAIFRHAGRAHVVGITGVPGSGKSTLVAKLVGQMRRMGRRVGVVAIDPSSPFSGGAILGDRIRMGEICGDPGVFVRSMATRGALGGLARGTLDAVDILDAAGYGIVIIETVGVGQDEVDVARAAHTTVVVSTPGLGDDIQAIKAGILEIADIHVVAKSDRPDADRTIADLKAMLAIGPRSRRSGDWQSPVLPTSAAVRRGHHCIVRSDRRPPRRARCERSHGRAPHGNQRAKASARRRGGPARCLRPPTRRPRGGVARGARRAHDRPAHGGETAAPPAPDGTKSMKQSDGRDPDAPALAAQIDAWEKNEVASFLARQPERQPEFRTLGGLPLKRVYTPLDLADTPAADVGLPGQYPYTRGPYPTMYRGRLWTMRQIAGFGTAEDTNGRFKYLIGQGQTGLSTDFDMPTLMGYDSDHPLCEGEVGREGVAVDTLADVEHLFDGIDLERISVSMTINPTAWILLAMYIALAKQRGCDLDRLSGTIQADILKEYQAQKEWIFPIAPSVRIVRDCITWCARNMKRYNPINISGYHISEAGSSPLDEAAFTMCNLVTYVDAVTKTGMHVDEFAPRLAFYYVAQADFFEEIAKLRAVRRVYAKIMRERFGARNPESMRLRFHCQTAAASLTRPQPQINIVRTGLQALAAVLGGAQSLHTNGMDEAFAIPTEEAMKIALRTQQIIAEESGVASVADPLGGSYFVESLTTEFERGIFGVLDEVERRGGTIKLIEEGWFQQRIADFAYETAKRKASGAKPVIGVNKYVEPDERFDVEIHPYDPTTAKRQIARLEQVRRERDQAQVARVARPPRRRRRG